MTTHALAVLVGTFELIALFVLLSAPVVLTASYIFFMARFKNSRLDLHAEEAKLLSELAKLESAAGVSNRAGSASPSPDKPERIHALNLQ